MKTFALSAYLALLLPVLACAASTAQRELAGALRATPDAANGEALFDHCASCHGADGGGQSDGSTPRIAGQHFRVLVKQLVDFRSGKRWDFRMEGAAEQHHLAGPQDIADVAAYVSKLTRPGTRGIGSGEFAALGSQLYADQCASCHGAAAEGNAQRSVPRLAGQHYGYLMRQMYDAVDGRRPALPRLHSQRIAPLDFEQVRALADYLSRIGWQSGEPLQP
ncbi:MAG: c-type cytochrome [Pseudomonadota bacterium]